MRRTVHQSPRDPNARPPQRATDARVPGASHYGWDYLGGSRVFSYAHQLSSLVALRPESVLEVGPGPGVITQALRGIGVKVTTVDVQEELEPDVVASVLELPFEDRVFDVAMCCQVLEHLPFSDFPQAIAELRRVASRGVLLSLPDCSSHYEITLRLPKLGALTRSLSRRRSVTDRYRKRALEAAGHHWEIGFPETPARTVYRTIESMGAQISLTWRVRELPYHRFFLLTWDGARLAPESDADLVERD